MNVLGDDAWLGQKTGPRNCLYLSFGQFYLLESNNIVQGVPVDRVNHMIKVVCEMVSRGKTPRLHFCNVVGVRKGIQL